MRGHREQKIVRPRPGRRVHRGTLQVIMYGPILRRIHIVFDFQKFVIYSSGFHTKFTYCQSRARNWATDEYVLFVALLGLLE